MSRIVPWRNKPTTLITQMLPVSAQLKLYLINEIGPTSFMFKDEHDNKFKVSIGSKISCSCGVVANDHCIHTLFVMLKKYQVPETHPIIWQASYLDSELQGLIQMKYREIKKQSVPTSKYIPKKKNNLHESKQQEDDFPPLGEDALCPICFEDMEHQCYTTCTTCRKSIHTECFKIWVRQKERDGVNVTCPMCRSKFQNPSLLIMKDLERWSKRFTLHKGSHCKGCGTKNIKGFIYKCLMCPSVQLCRFCYDSFEHYEHVQFFVKELDNEPWRHAPIRQKKKKPSVEYRPNLSIKQYTGNIQSPEFILSLFPTLRDQNMHKQSNSLGIVGNDMLNRHMCFKCQTIGDQSMRKLNCGHLIHTTCLQSMITNKDWVCDIDEEAICPGYLSALGIKIPKKNKRTADIAFIRSNEETQKIKKHLGTRILGTNVTQQKEQKKETMSNFSVGRKVERFNEKERGRENSVANKFNAKSKDRNFRIMKKTIIDRRQDLQSLGVGVGFGSPMMVTGLNNHSSQHPHQVIPKPPSHQVHRNNRAHHPNFPS